MLPALLRLTDATTDPGRATNKPAECTIRVRADGSKEATESDRKRQKATESVDSLL